MQRPASSEYAPYYHKYVELVKSDTIFPALENQLTETLTFLEGIPSEKWAYRYGPNKWTLIESWVHVLDVERVFAYRALRIGRGDKTPIPGFDHNAYVPASNANKRKGDSLLNEFKAVRSNTIELFKNLPEEQLTFFGSASEKPITPRALAYMIMGHLLHHKNLTVDRYL